MISGFLAFSLHIVVAKNIYAHFSFISIFEIEKKKYHFRVLAFFISASIYIYIYIYIYVIYT